jgi:mRNA-degrading endonuclease RelE of RelBE toxin-antitoxin system
VVVFKTSSVFEKEFRKLRDRTLKDRLTNQIDKLADNPEFGKPMQYGRKGTRELYVEPYRLSYLYSKEENTIILLSLYHKNRQ